VGGLIYSNDISALFEEFDSEIEYIAKDAYGLEIWQIAELKKFVASMS
jgi:hypothetical protein